MSTTEPDETAIARATIRARIILKTYTNDPHETTSLIAEDARVLLALHARCEALAARMASFGEPCHICHTTSGEHFQYCSAVGDGLDRLMLERNKWLGRAEAADRTIATQAERIKVLEGALRQVLRQCEVKGSIRYVIGDIASAALAQRATEE